MLKLGRVSVNPVVTDLASTPTYRLGLEVFLRYEGALYQIWSKVIHLDVWSWIKNEETGTHDTER